MSSFAGHPLEEMTWAVGITCGKVSIISFIPAHAPFWSAFTSSPASSGRSFALRFKSFNKFSQTILSFHATICRRCLILTDEAIFQIKSISEHSKTNSRVYLLKFLLTNGRHSYSAECQYSQSWPPSRTLNWHGIPAFRIAR